MRNAIVLAITIALLLGTSGLAAAETKAKSHSATSADCNRVYKAKADADKDVSTKQLAQELQLPVKTVQTCLRRMRQAPRATPHARGGAANPE